MGVGGGGRGAAWDEEDEVRQGRWDPKGQDEEDEVRQGRWDPKGRDEEDEVRQDRWDPKGQDEEDEVRQDRWDPKGQDEDSKGQGPRILLEEHLKLGVLQIRHSCLEHHFENTTANSSFL